MPRRGECAPRIRPRRVERERLRYLKADETATGELTEHVGPTLGLMYVAVRIRAASNPTTPANRSEHEGPDHQGKGKSAHSFFEDSITRLRRGSRLALLSLSRQ